MNTTTKSASIVRIVTTDYSPEGLGSEVPEVGQAVCLIEWEDEMPERGTPVWARKGSHLTTEPRTNMSHEIKWEGWLGTTDDLSETARGAWRVVSVTPWDEAYMGRFACRSRWQVRLAPAALPEDDDADAEREPDRYEDWDLDGPAHVREA